MDDGRRRALRTLETQYSARPFRIRDAVNFGLSRSMLYRMRDAGELVSVGRGLLQLPEGGAGLLSDLALVSARAPVGTICLNSALAFWDLTDEIPATVHLAVPKGAHRPIIRQPRTTVHVFDADSFALDREQASTDVDEPFWIYSAERSIVDAMRLAHLVGRDVGLHALNQYLNREGAQPRRLLSLARRLGGTARIQAAIEAILG